MADGGALYTGFDEDFPRHMARLAAQADVVTPNLTEACLLTGTPYREDYDLPQLRDILRKLAELGPRHVVLTGVPYGPDKLGVLAYTPGGGSLLWNTAAAALTPISPAREISSPPPA